MSAAEILQLFAEGMRQTSFPEYLAVIAGIASVLFSRSENILVYPTGIASTLIYVFLSFRGGLYAEAGLNIYYALMSIAGWYLWARRKSSGEKRLHITSSNRKDWLVSTVFFVCMWVLLYGILRKLTNSTVPLADAFASATAYTAMLLMNKKKTESWWWWILTNLVSIPLYFSKGYVFTSVQFLFFLVIAILGWVAWNKKKKAEVAKT